MAKDVRGKEVSVGSRVALFGTVKLVRENGTVVVTADNPKSAESDAHAAEVNAWRGVYATYQQALLKWESEGRVGDAPVAPAACPAPPGSTTDVDIPCGGLLEVC